MFLLHSPHISVKSNLEKPARSQFIKNQEAHWEIAYYLTNSLQERHRREEFWLGFFKEKKGVVVCCVHLQTQGIEKRS